MNVCIRMKNFILSEANKVMKIMEGKGVRVKPLTRWESGIPEQLIPFAVKTAVTERTFLLYGNIFK